MMMRLSRQRNRSSKKIKMAIIITVAVEINDSIILCMSKMRK